MDDVLVNRRWTVAGFAAIAVVMVLDQLLSDPLVPVTLLAVGPVIAAVGSSPRVTAVVAVVAVVMSCVAIAFEQDPVTGADSVRAVTVLVLGALAVVLASLRVRLERPRARPARRSGGWT